MIYVSKEFAYLRIRWRSMSTEDAKAVKMNYSVLIILKPNTKYKLTMLLGGFCLTNGSCCHKTTRLRLAANPIRCATPW